MAETGVNYLGKLNELGQKCRFVVDLEVTDAFIANAPSFKCVIRIPYHDIMVEQVGSNKKLAKAAAAQVAFEKICEKIKETSSTSVEKIALKLKEITISSDTLTSSIEFYKKLASLDVSKINVDNGNSYSDLNDLITPIQCTLSYKKGESKSTSTGSSEFQFICEIRPTGSLSPVVTCCGWSLENMEKAKTKAVNQLLDVLKIYSINTSNPIAPVE